MGSTDTLAVPEHETRHQANNASGKRGSAFWLTMLALIVSTFLSALDLTAIGTALPTIVADLNGGDDFSWAGSAYALSSTAVLPLSGSLADIFGRRPVLLGAILFFALGSALNGAAQSMNMLIAARTVQGIGGGAIITLTEIVISDLVPLAERGTFQGVIGLVWALASGVGPPLGGVIAGANWRWLFYMNLPLSGIALVLVWFFLSVRTPDGSMREKFARIDFMGNAIVISGTTLAVVGLTFGGVRFPWSSVQVLAPLIIGLALIAGFMVYEAKIPREPTVPWVILSNRTTVGGYVSTFVHGLTSISIVYYIAIYFQAVLGASSSRSGVNQLALSLTIALFALIAGVFTQVAQRYRPFIAVGWVFIIVGFGITTLFKADSTTAQWVGYQIVVAAGIGLIYTAPVFPILAPLPVNRTAPALAFFAFVRAFAQTWGITIAATVLQNALKAKLPAAFVAQFTGGVEIAYAAIPIIRDLPEPLRAQVRVAFAESMATIWKVMTGISALGVLSILLLKEVPMPTHKDDKYGLHANTEVNADEEKRESRQASTTPSVF
ncbi:hypothetical protein PHLGIDRAFT_120696 [Phlebiopsis gigantea 11061_1 CR5-6]|uniref:Major facilitator superfamily (MFS) profile domain-containing protein n=1 Tax=Phlebiopsis gigantea (strain 11061_1 CR5-6) TaxID=745531 RepID=A0A0C3PFN9_PHLG1|nr:hypothetical protein PHLGIDRAFT_120696 [Phlebiopsis gigantea 11061_1 CR5-6]